MDVVRIGLSLRALRRRRGWRQEDLARRIPVSRSSIARLERGGADRVTVRTLERIAAELGARVDLRVLWQGEGLDRLLDARHAALVEVVARTLVGLGWEVATEVSFNVDGERGSIDILAFHAATRSLLVVEVKSAVPDLQVMLFTLDRKGRIARHVARERGWDTASVSRLLVLPEDRTARRRVTDHGATFAASLPARNVGVKRWLAHPVGALAGVLFAAAGTPAAARHRVSDRARVATSGSVRLT